MKKTSEGKVVRFIELLDEQEITTLYKHFSGVTTVKFKNRQDAEIRLFTVAMGKPRHVMVEAFKAAKLPQNTIDQYQELLSGPIAFPQGRMTEKDMKKHTEALMAGKKGEEKNGNGGRAMSASTAAILLALQTMEPNKEGQLDTTAISEHLKTNVNVVCRAADALQKQGLLELEDDSTDEHLFYWLKLTEAGKQHKVEQPSAKLPASNPGPSPKFGSKYLFKLVDKNPRREGTHGWKSFELIKNGMSFEDYKKAGGRNNDLAWDIEHKWVELRDTNEAPKVETKEEPKPQPQPEAPAKKDKGQVIKPGGKRAAEPPVADKKKGTKKK